MASIIVHIAVADKLYNKIKNKLNINYYDYILGSIAPDISKTINEPKNISHFADNDEDIPNLNKFLEKYALTLNNSFNLGYFTHLYTDKLFYLDYYPLFLKDEILYSQVRKLDGNIINLTKQERTRLLYNDYTNLNQQLIDEYNLSLDIFYNEFTIPKTNLTEIPINKLNILIETAGIIIESIAKEKEYIINLSSIKSFIDDTVDDLYTTLISLEVI